MGRLNEFDRETLARICSAHGVKRLQLFGSALSSRFDPDSSDVDILVEFEPGVDSPFDSYFDLREELEKFFDRQVDLVMNNAIKNPYLAKSIRGGAKEVYSSSWRTSLIVAWQ